MPPQSEVDATVADKLYFVIGVFGVFLEAVSVVLRYPFTSASKVQPTLGREITRVVLRAFHDLGRFNIAQLQWAFPSSTVAYEKWLAAHAASEDVPAEVFTELLGDEGAKLHWVGHQDAKKVILYYHGGGYVLALSSLHFNFNSYIRREVKRQSGVDVKIAFLEYTLGPKHIYPTQFRQAALALQRVIDSGISPADLIIGGDSVGGQLALQVLSHILHPHPSLQRIQAPAVPIAGFLTISPWVIYDSHATTFYHKDKDILTPNTIHILRHMIIRATVLNGKAESDGFWSEPLLAPPEWWRSTTPATRTVLISYGARELFTEDNAALAKKMREGVAGTNVVVKDVEEPQGVHIGPLIDANFGRAPSESSRVIVDWVTACLTNPHVSLSTLL